MGALALCNIIMQRHITSVSVSVRVSVVEKLEVTVTEKANGVSFLIQVTRTNDDEIVKRRSCTQSNTPLSLI